MTELLHRQSDTMERLHSYLVFSACRSKWCGCEPGAGHARGHQEGGHLHPLQCGGGDPETRGEAAKR